MSLLFFFFSYWCEQICSHDASLLGAFRLGSNMKFWGSKNGAGDFFLGSCFGGAEPYLSRSPRASQFLFQRQTPPCATLCGLLRATRRLLRDVPCRTGGTLAWAARIEERSRRSERSLRSNRPSVNGIKWSYCAYARPGKFLHSMQCLAQSPI
jgi:hypothetical protein